MEHTQKLPGAAKWTDGFQKVTNKWNTVKESFCGFVLQKQQMEHTPGTPKVAKSIKDQVFYISFLFGLEHRRDSRKD